jgi:multiple sugar transport system substrate-binding protein
VAEADCKTVNLNSKATIESVKFMTAFWKDAHDESRLAWTTGPTKKWENHKMWGKDPVLTPHRTPAGSGYGYAGPAGPKAAEVLAKYIIVDMYAKRSRACLLRMQ